MSEFHSLNGIDLDGVLGYAIFAGSRILIDKERKSFHISRQVVESFFATRKELRISTTQFANLTLIYNLELRKSQHDTPCGIINF